MRPDGLGKLHLLAYAVGHFLNDLCNLLFYQTWYIKNVVGLSANIAATALLSGQLADGLMTPIVGFLSDKYSTPCGKRTPWYLFGTLLVGPTYLGIFIYPSFINTCQDEEECAWMPTRQAMWYITMPALYNIGWAAVQISNMAIVN